MGEHEGWPQASGLLPNGLLANESASVIRVLDVERWSKAEKRTAELIACIQPNQPSEDRRNAVADYVQRLIMKCFPCQVFTFGSVPLKTYLPDGDIDVTAFSKNQSLKDTWATKVRDILLSEEKNENAEFHVKEVQYIQADVKIIKCLVENIIVDISFDQLGGLCTLCFLEEVDHLINQNHLFKRSIILIKAWCYYESRILGAHHGLISTYALETLVLYIFHVFNNSFAGPLEVLYRFLEFFSNFDWDNFCVSLWGPVPISSLPDVTAEPPRKDGGELLLSKLFLDACSSVYAVFPGGLENQGQPFISKHFNVIDPLRVNNNLGRSVSKGNFYRIRSAFAFGAKRLARLLDCPKENIIIELNQFFMNTWERHGSGIRPDAPLTDFLGPSPSNPDHGSYNNKNNSGIKRTNETTSIPKIEVEGSQSSRPLSSQRASYPQESFSKSNDVSQVPPTESHKIEKGNSDKSAQIDRSRISLKPNNTVSQVQGRYLFARTRSSPELTDAYCESFSRARRNKPAESGKSLVASLKKNSNRMKETVSESVSTQRPLSLSNDPLNGYVDDAGTDVTSIDHASVVGAQAMHQEEQDIVNMMSSSSINNFGAQVPMPLNMVSNHLPIPISQSVLASMGYAQRNFPGMIPANFPLLDPHWTTNFPMPLTHYFPGVGLPTNSEDVIEQGSENVDSLEMAQLDADNEYWHEREAGSNGFLDPDDGSLDGKHPSTSANSGNSRKAQQKFTKGNRKSTREDYVEVFKHQDNRVNELYSDDRVSSARFSSASQSGSVRSKTSSESSWDGSSTRLTKVGREKRGKKPPNVHGKGKNIYENATAEVDVDNREWNTVSTMGNEVGFEGARTNGSDPVIPMTPMVLGSGSRFYPTGPPVPFFTMLPFYNFPTSGSHLGGEDGSNNSDSGQNFDTSDGHDGLEAYNSMKRPTTTVTLEEPKCDILNSDFASHWQNLQYGRFCQTPRFPTPVICPSPVAVPPMYLQGRFPWDGPGRPNMNLFSQLTSYGPRLVPVSNRPTMVYQQYVEELPRYRSGTGTYLPNPKATVRDRHSSGTRRNNYNNDKSDYGDREGNWNTAKSRAAARNHNRSQSEKSRIDHMAANDNRADRPWGTYRHEPLPSYQAQNGPLRPSSSQSVAYGMYPLPGVDPRGMTSNGTTAPSFVMLYPYDHNSGYVTPGEQLEFGSLGPVGSGDGTRLRGPFEDQRFHGGSTQQSSPDQPSSPRFHRSVVQRNYELKDEDFPPLAFPNQEGGDWRGWD